MYFKKDYIKKNCSRHLNSMDDLKLLKNKSKAKPSSVNSIENQIDPEHFFEKMTYQHLYSDLIESLEVDMNELSNIENPQFNNKGSLVSTNSSVVNSVVSSFKGETKHDQPKNKEEEEFVSQLLNEDEKKPKKKKKVLRLKNYMESFFNQSSSEREKQEGKRTTFA